MCPKIGFKWKWEAGCLKMSSFFIKPSALWDNNTLYIFNSWDKFVFFIKTCIAVFIQSPSGQFFQPASRAELSKESAPLSLPLCTLCVNRRENSERPARNTPLRGWARTRLSSAIGRINSIHGLILRSLCSFIFLIKKTPHTQKLPHLSPNLHFCHPFCSLLVKSVHYVFTSLFYYYLLLTRHVKHKILRHLSANFKNETNNSTGLG